MELRDLRYFVVLAEELHFGRAARRLSISAPPLTQRIKRLEAEVGVLLFKRTKRSVAITAAGVVLLVEARHILQQANGIVPALRRAARGETGTLRVGVIGSAIFSWARVVQEAMADRLPDVHVVWQELSSVAQVDALRQGRLDLGLVNTPIEHAGIKVGRPIREPLVAAMSVDHRLAGRRSIALEALRDEVFVVGARHLSPGYYDRFISACNAAGFTPNVDHQAGHMFTYISLVAIGAGVSLVPRSMASAGFTGVAYVRIANPALFVEVSPAWDPANPSPVLRRALTLLDFGSEAFHARRRAPRIARATRPRGTRAGKR
jgi:DNA-binding transcriptional LysR family regulator